MQKPLTHEDIVRQLSDYDRAALELLSHDPPRREIDSLEAYRLLQLGLAELLGGRLVLTNSGITALVAARDL